MSDDRTGASTGLPSYSYAFQPIVDVAAGEVQSYEALIRGSGGESAQHVFAQVKPEHLYQLDRESRITAVALAGRLGVSCHLNLNVLPRDVQRSSSELPAMIEMAERCGIQASRLILELTEGEAIDDHARFAQAIDTYRALGVKVAIDDFGAGYSGLNLLADFQPDMIKLDMNLVRGIESRGPRQSIARAIMTVCNDLGIEVVAEGVETLDEFVWFEEEGVRLFQGYLFAKPGFECLPLPQYPVPHRAI
ncbi:MAG: EAL domain-containing protein [bacterium]